VIADTEGYRSWELTVMAIEEATLASFPGLRSMFLGFFTLPSIREEIFGTV